MTHRLLIGGVVLAALVAPAIVGQVAVQAGDEQAYENTLAACERGNAVREVLYRNTVAAVEQSRRANDPPAITRAFRDNLNTLLSVDYTDPRTGRVDCEAIIAKP